MANYGSKDLLIELQDAGAVYRDITQYVRSLNDVEIEALIEQSHSFGDAWAEFLYTGFAKANAITLQGIYDDAANTPYALFVRGASRNLRITWGGGHQTVFPSLMQKWARGPQLEKAHTYKLTLQPTGAPTES
jgi:hypothetical protein